jgi:uncharacterized membrane protein
MARADAPARSSRWPRTLRAFAVRPRLSVSLLIGVVVWSACVWGLRGLSWSSSAIIGWDAVCVAFLFLTTPVMVGQDSASMSAKAASQDEGQGVILGLVIIATAASLAAVAAELSLARAADGAEKIMRVGLAAVTVAVSWAMMQLIFALHYAHGYYASRATPENPDAVAGGLDFPGDEDPDYWDFVHFSVVIGVASQTADIAFTAKSLRRTGTLHGVAAFVFNTIVVALTINLVASLIGG